LYFGDGVYISLFGKLTISSKLKILKEKQLLAEKRKKMVFWKVSERIPEGFISLEVAVFSMTDRIRAVDPNFQVGAIYFDKYAAALRKYILGHRLQCAQVKRRLYVLREEIAPLVFSGRKGEMTKIEQRDS